MKNQWLTAVLLGLVLLSSGAFASGDKEISRRQVPQAVLEAFQKSYPNAADIEYKEKLTDDKPSYEVEFKDKGNEFEALYSVEGTLLEIEEEIANIALPQAIVQSVKKAYPNATIKEAERITKPGGYILGYKVEIKDGGNELELEIDGSGQIGKVNKD